MKYRAKRKLNGAWVYGSLVKTVDNQGKYEDDDWDFIIEKPDREPPLWEPVRVISNTICRTTPFKIREQDLYESDIIREELEGDQADEMHWYVVTWINEWGMFGCLHIGNEYHQYVENGIDALEEAMFWTFPIDPEEKYSRKFIAGNIHDNPELLIKKESENDE